jgi:pantoate--beta-alanine ligase
LGYLETVLEGKFRPGHFQGVCQVMSRLLDIIEPEQLFMGEKDLQQCLVVRNLLNLRFPQVHFHKCPTLREKDGLAMSSRNLRLSPEERSQAPALPRALNFIRDNIEKMGWKNARLEASNRMSAAGFRLDYLELARSQDLSIKDAYEAVEDLVVLVAAFLGSVRLIDNLPLAAKH